MSPLSPSTPSELMEFIYRLSHDLGAPIRQMREMSRLLVEHLAERTDEEDRKFLRHILSSADKSELMMGALIEYYRLGSTTVKLAPANLRDALGTARQRLQKELEDCSLFIDESSLPGAVIAEPQLLAQLFYYLLDNAAKFRRKNATPYIRVYGRQAADCWNFAVEDNGPGVPEPHREEIFQLFRRLHPDGTYPGIGAGLALAQKITQLHAGVIICAPRPSGGSIFTFSLPRLPMISPASH